MSFELEQRDIRRLRRTAIKFHDLPLKRKIENKKSMTIDALSEARSTLPT
jgi:hypothetical protein